MSDGGDKDNQWIVLVKNYNGDVTIYVTTRPTQAEQPPTFQHNCKDSQTKLRTGLKCFNWLSMQLCTKSINTWSDIANNCWLIIILFTWAVMCDVTCHDCQMWHGVTIYLMLRNIPALIAPGHVHASTVLWDSPVIIFTKSEIKLTNIDTQETS